MNVKNVFTEFLAWLFNDDNRGQNLTSVQQRQLEWPRVVFFIGLHISCLSILFVGVSGIAVAVAVLFYVLRMFFITAFYHRYFAHRSFRVSRLTQFLMAVAGCTAGQRGPLWWSGHHRIHHSVSDTAADPHTPRSGFWNSHTLWFLRRGNFAIPSHRVKDWLRYPELRWLEKLDWIPFLLLGAACYGLGALLQAYMPTLQTSGVQMLVWGFIISTVVLYHATYTINSLAHRYGSRRFATKDDSRNNVYLALLTLGEGWHNNHHRYPLSARQGFFWWEIDLSYYGLKFLASIGIVHDLRAVPASVLAEAQHSSR